MLKVKNLEKNGRAVPNQFVIESHDDLGNNHHVVFQSYESTIADVDYENMTITIYPDYDYSQTTIRNRNVFFADICMAALATTKALEKALKAGCADCGYTGNWIVKKSA